MFKNLTLILIGTQLGPYVNPYIARFVFDPLIAKLHEIDMRDIENFVNRHRPR